MKYKLLYHLLDNLDIAPETMELIPIMCPSCRHLLYSSDNLKEVVCLNEFCVDKICTKLETTLKSLGLEKFGYATCRSLVDENNITRVMYVFTLGVNQMPSSCSPRMKQNLWEQLQSVKNITLGEFIRAFNFDGFQTMAIKLFEKYDDIYKFYDDMYKSNDSNAFIGNLLGISKGKTTTNICIQLSMNEEYIKYVYKFFNIIPIVSETISIYMSENVLTIKDDNGKPFRPRKKFHMYVQRKFCKKVNIVLRSTVTRDTDFLLIDNRVGNKHENMAIQYGIPIVTYKQFYDYLCNKYKEED